MKNKLVFKHSNGAMSVIAPQDWTSYDIDRKISAIVVRKGKNIVLIAPFQNLACVYQEKEGAANE